MMVLNLNEDFSNKFDNLTRSTVDNYINNYKDLEPEQILLLDDITRKISNNTNSYQKIIEDLYKGAINIEYYEACNQIKKMKSSFKEAIEKVKNEN